VRSKEKSSIKQAISTEQVLQLSEDDFIGTGTRRTCYAYPGHPELCIKIPKAKKNGFKQQKREVKYYRKLEHREVPTERITRYHGSLQTSLGEGYLYDAVRDADGQPSLQMIHYLRNETERDSEFLDMLNLLEDYLFKYRVIIYDLSPWNILCRKGSDGSLEPFIIDGVGDIVAIPVLNLSDRLVKQKIKRRWMRMVSRMEKNFKFMHRYSFSHD